MENGIKPKAETSAEGKSRKQNRGMMLRLPPEDWKKVEKLCVSYGESVQKLFRRFVTGVELPKTVLHPESTREILIGIARIGTNVNQIARRVNQGAQRGWYHEFEDVNRKLDEIKAMIGRQLGHC